MKVFFNAHGWRETKNWECHHCHNFWTGGMDIMVDESAKDHLAKCPARQKDENKIKDKIERYVQILIDRVNHQVHPKESPLGYYHLGRTHVLQELLIVLERM